MNSNLTEFKEQTNQRFEELEVKIKNAEKELSNQISKLQRSVVLLENKFSTEILALFDGYKANRELLEDRNDKISILLK